MQTRMHTRARRPTEMQQEVRPLLVRDPTVRVVRVLAPLEVDNEALVFWLVFVQLERVDKGLVADEEREAALGGRVQLLEEQALHVGRPALVEPEVRRVGMPGGIRMVKVSQMEATGGGEMGSYVTPLPNHE